MLWHYFRHPFVGIRPRYRASECFRLEVFEAHHGGVTQRGISRTHRISPTTVERWYQSHISQKYKEIISRPCPEMLGIDEHFFTRKKGYATTFVDLRHRSVFDVKLGCSELSLRSYLRHLPNKENVKLIKAWQQHHPEGSKNRGLLSLMRRHRWHLSEEKNSNLQRYLADYPMLKTLYEVKQKLIRYMLLKTMNEKRMEKTLPRFLDLLEQLHHSPLRALKCG